MLCEIKLLRWKNKLKQYADLRYLLQICNTLNSTFNWFLSTMMLVTEDGERRFVDYSLRWPHYELPLHK